MTAIEAPATPETGLVKMTDLLFPDAREVPQDERLGRFLLDHGVDLAATPAPHRLARGTPVYVDVTADPVEVQRRMAQAHVKMLFVLDGDGVAGVVDAADLAERAESLSWMVEPVPQENGRNGG